MFNGDYSMTQQEIQEARVSKRIAYLQRRRNYQRFDEVFDDLEEIMDLTFPQFKEDEDEGE